MQIILKSPRTCGLNFTLARSPQSRLEPTAGDDLTGNDGGFAYRCPHSRTGQIGRSKIFSQGAGDFRLLPHWHRLFGGKNSHMEAKSS